MLFIYKQYAVGKRVAQLTGTYVVLVHVAVVTRALTSAAADADSSRSSSATAADRPLAFIHVVTANDNFIVCSFAGASLAAIRQRVQIVNLCNTKNFIAT